MKISEYLQGVGRPVAYYPGLRKITGSTTATILLCQLLYWTGKEKAGDGWIFKRAEGDDEQSIEGETGLSYKEQRAARRVLKVRGLLEERYARLEHVVYFRVNMERLDELWEQAAEHKSAKPHAQGAPAQRSVGQLPNGQLADLPTVISIIGTTQSTGENTKEHSTAHAGESASIQEKERKEISPEEDVIRKVQAAFAENDERLRDIPGKGDPLYPKWRRGYKGLAEICARKGTTPAKLALWSASEADRMGSLISWPGSYWGIAGGFPANAKPAFKSDYRTPYVETELERVMRERGELEPVEA
jgi:hypothetical protein